MGAEFLLAVLTTLLLAYAYLTRNYKHWQVRRVPYDPPVVLFGNATDIFLQKKSVGDLCRDLYAKMTGPFMGLFVCDKPYLLVKDLDLIKTVLIRDFSSFDNRSVGDNKKDDPMGSHMLFLLKNPDWKFMRGKLTPAFTPGKMKLIYCLMGASAKELLHYLHEQTKRDRIIESRELAAKYTTDAITAVSFGLKADCFQEEISEFREVSRRVFNWRIPERAIATMCYFVAPGLVRLFRLRFIDAKSSNFFRETFWNTMQERERSQRLRNDLIDILLEIKKQEHADDMLKLDGDIIVAQAAQFFLGGFETTSSTIAFCLYELARNPDIQTELRREIIRMKNQHKGFCYDAIVEMKLLDLCIKVGERKDSFTIWNQMARHTPNVGNLHCTDEAQRAESLETLRKYPALSFLDRRCNSDYQIPNTDVILEKGTGIFISLLGLHYDPEYFPNPQRFDPERFLPENADKRPNFTYMPFGEGPRTCIGARFGLMNSKSAIAHIISEFDVEICPKTQDPLVIDPRGFLMAPKGGLHLKFTPFVLCC